MIDSDRGGNVQNPAGVEISLRDKATGRLPREHVMIEQRQVHNLIFCVPQMGQKIRVIFMIPLSNELPSEREIVGRKSSRVFWLLDYSE